MLGFWTPVVPCAWDANSVMSIISLCLHLRARVAEGAWLAAPNPMIIGILICVGCKDRTVIANTIAGECALVRSIITTGTRSTRIALLN
jgi:hypothetical protein